jgi:hypothetical protein
MDLQKTLTFRKLGKCIRVPQIHRMIMRDNAVISVELVERIRHRMGGLMQNCMSLIATMTLRIILEECFEKDRTVPVHDRSIIYAVVFERSNSGRVILARFVLRRNAVYWYSGILTVIRIHRSMRRRERRYPVPDRGGELGSAI